MNPPDSHAPSTGDTLSGAFARHHAPLVRYATRLTGDSDRARDIVQDTFVKLMAQPPGAVDGHLAEWLFTVCRHRAVDVLRKEGRMKSLDTFPADAMPAATEPPPAAALERAETHDALLRLIGGLPPNQQEVVRLKFQNGFSYQEISRITALSVSNVGFQLHTALRRLRADFAALQP
jgi:RNA polymerase sigma factor (sigma-70 family)